jgi:formimidoylglutamate deiminase
MAFHKSTPIAWLADNLPMDERFNIVHCTHLTDDEVTLLAESGANVVLCPGTEGNLGDGIFRLTDFANQGGRWSIGTDSHISLNPLEDLRWLDYAQRFTTHKRNTFDDGATMLIQKTFHAGNAAMGFRQADYFAIGSSLDVVVYDSHRPLLMQADKEHLLSAILYTASPAEILGTIVNGKWIVKNNYHFREGEIFKAFSAMKYNK